MTIGVTLGDANGVGPEIVLKSFISGKLPAEAVVIGDYDILDYYKEKLGLELDIERVENLSDRAENALCVYDMRIIDRGDITIGQVSEPVGHAAYQYLIFAIEAAKANQIDAIVTLPVNKEAIRLSVPEFSGHTGVIAEACGDADYTMTLISDKYVVSHVSSHVSLRQAIESLSPARILKVIELTSDIMTKLHREEQIAVLGLNPHAGESGAFGDEDEATIVPAIQEAWNRGIEVTGPVAPDTAFMRALNGEFNALVCMYHDQGHIPMKTIGFENTVNVTVGLPIIRTSVDHGTAYDIAGQGKVSIESFVHACNLARQLVQEGM